MTTRGQPRKATTGATMKPDDELLTTEQAAQLTKLSVSWYQNKRWEGRGGPPYIRHGRIVRYVKRELLAWWRERGVEPSSP